ncbi:hypothetical protein [Parasphingopyxis marina]|uniref:Uncharacterized protein n=1 Tax=Parasphingopyxis marina TaxID=2761622 RepID=A0A842HZ81_9SPHN|nr:hypothetical protein [Parasphingopyxis marina]MBC2778165.1 hypothetical protein [Parasphingopyxis marina]
MMLFAAMLAACTMEGMIDRMVGEEDQAFVQQFVSDMREGDMEALEAVIDPDIWKESAGEFEQAAASYPEGEGETRIISYSMNSTSLGDNAPTNKEFTLVTTDDSYWTVTRINTYQRGGSPTVTAWSVEGMDEPPAEMEALETVGTVLTVAGIGLLIFVGIVIWLVVFLVRRSNRKSRERRNAGIS